MRDLKMEDFRYELPDHRIARFPLSDRSASKLLVLREEEISEVLFGELPGYFGEQDLLVMNDSKVIRARLVFTRTSGARIEVFLLEPADPAEYAGAFASRGSCSWHCLVGNLKKWKEESLMVTSANAEIRLYARRGSPGGTITFSWEPPELSFAEVVEQMGETPIPPYLNRSPEVIDSQRYQTVYARVEGSVAAPTAGLHFTPAIIENLVRNGTSVERLTLHVGAGTFAPVKSATVADHLMHQEWVSIPAPLVRRLTDTDCRITALGTTTLRSLESLYWLGLLLREGKDEPAEGWHIRQWLPYEKHDEPGTRECLGIVAEYLDRMKLDSIKFRTGLILVPGYRFRMADRLITNFHQPGSTLLLLVAAFAGEHWKQVYRYALDNDFRFLSYGDGSLLYLHKS